MLGLNSERHEIELRPKQEVQVDGFAIGRDLADKVHPTVVPCLRHCDELFDSILSPKPEAVWTNPLKPEPKKADSTLMVPWTEALNIAMLFGWNPILDMRSRTHSTGLEIGEERISDGEPRHVSGEAAVFCVPVPRYLGCILRVRHRIEDRLLWQSRRKLPHSGIPDQSEFVKTDWSIQRRHGWHPGAAGELFQKRRYVSLTSAEIRFLSTFSGNPLFASASSSSRNKEFARLSTRSREP